MPKLAPICDCSFCSSCRVGEWKISIFPSQNSDLNNEQLDEIEQKAQAKNTKKATGWGIKMFDKWCDKRKISVDLKTVSPTDLRENCKSSTLKLSSR